MEIGKPCQGLITGDVSRFVRKWYECNREKLSIPFKNDNKWYPYNNGGEYRRWYGNNEDVVNWENNGYEIMNFKDEKGKLRSRPQNVSYYFKEGATWTAISSGTLSVRYFGEGTIFSNAGMALFGDKNTLLYLIAFLNSKVTQLYLAIYNGGLNYNQGNIATLPIMKNKDELVISYAKKCIELEKMDWDSFETSWDFKCHPLIPNIRGVWDIEEMKNDRDNLPQRLYIEACFDTWQEVCDNRFHQLKASEVELNCIFIDIYGLQDELTPEVEDKDITVRKADLDRDIRGFISYVVGCMFGRYSLDAEGLVYAGGEWDECKYLTYIPDGDNCIPITDEEYFSDDIVNRFVEFVKTVYGEDTLEENLDFIANALGYKGDTSREVIRNYFLKDFYADHLKVYQKRPIYWLFDSGKQNGFKALIYMHRYDADTVGRVRTDYLHKAQKYVETAMQSAQYTIDNATSASEKSKATKAVTKYTKQLAEMKIYDEAIAHVANQRIEIDLDDGVKVNYEKFQGVEVAQEGKKALKVDLLAKIK